MFPQFKDVVTHAKPSIIFSDGEWEMTSAEWRTPELLAWLFNESPVRGEVVINDRWGKETRHHQGGYFTTEYTPGMQQTDHPWEDRKSTRLNSSHLGISYAVFCLKDTATTEIYTLSLHDALPIWARKHATTKAATSPPSTPRACSRPIIRG